MRRFIVLMVMILAFYGQALGFTFGVICDTRSDASASGRYGVNTAAVQAVCAELTKRRAAFVLAPGDFICGNVDWYNKEGEPPANTVQYQSFLEAAGSQGVGLAGSGKSCRLFPVRGNHECYHDTKSPKALATMWQREMGAALPRNGPKGEEGLTYSFTWGNALFLGIDEYVHAGASVKTGIGVNQPWVQKTLDENIGAEHLFVFGHTPAFAAHHADCLADNEGARDAFLRSLYSRGGVYFCGHDHFYARAEVPVVASDGTAIVGYIPQVITPSGAPFLTGSREDNHKWDGVYGDPRVIPSSYMDNTLGFQLVTVEGAVVTVSFMGTQDASTWVRREDGSYAYTWNDDWASWTFAELDRFSYTREGTRLAQNH